jgi:4-aminobutyrate aminotransferase
MFGSIRHPLPTEREVRAADSEELRRSLADLVGVDPSRVFLTHGATEANGSALLYLRTRAAPSTPIGRIAFPEYPPLFDGIREAGFALTEDPGPVRVAVLSQPRNPEGDLWGRDRLEEFGAGAEHLLVDETFREFSGSPSLTALSHLRVWASGSFTKFFAGDDLRVGFLVTPETESEAYARFHGLVFDQVPDYSVAAALACLRALERIRRDVGRVLRPNRAAWRRAFPGERVPVAPVGFDRHNVADGDSLAQRCLTASVLVCPGGLFGDPRGVRLCLTRRTFPQDLAFYLAVRDSPGPSLGPVPPVRGHRGGLDRSARVPPEREPREGDLRHRLDVARLHSAGFLLEERFGETDGPRRIGLVHQEEASGELRQDGPGRDDLVDLLDLGVVGLLRRHERRTTRELGIKTDAPKASVRSIEPTEKILPPSRPWRGGVPMSQTLPVPASAHPEPSKGAPRKGILLKTPIPGPNAQKIIAADARSLMTSTKTAPIVAESGTGVWITDVDGNRLLDFASGVAVNTLGYSHPEVVRAVRDQVGKLSHFAGTDFYYENQVRLAERLIRLTPGEFEKKIFFTNSGTESAEAALKLAHWNRKRPIIVGLIGAFHGRTMGSLTMTSSKPVQRQGYAPFVGGGTHIPAPYCYRCPYKLEYPSCDLYCAKILKELYFQTLIPPDDVAAFLAEPVMGEGGYVVPPAGWHKTIKSILDEHGILFIDDEVQAGMGRTGKWFAIEHHGIVPDIVTLAKALGGGLPMGAMIFRKDLDYTYQGSHSNTFGGNLVSVAASNATIDVIEKEHLLDNARIQGDYLLSRLRELAQKYPDIGDVRGLGLMTATEFVVDQKTKEPAVKLRDRVLEEAYHRGLILLPCGRSSIRYIPPIIIRREEIDEAIEVMDASIQAARARA